MEETGIVFELLKKIKKQAIKESDWAVLQAAQNAERVALEEIHSVNLNRDIPRKTPRGGLIVKWEDNLIQASR